MNILKKIAACFMIIVLSLSCGHITILAAVKATTTVSSVFVNSELVAFKAYTIEGSNYFKLRDIAMVLDGTTKQFSVEYESDNNAIALHSDMAYTPVGGELVAVPGSDNVKATNTTSKVYLDGAAIDLKAYTITGNNYFKLRDIGAALDFSVIWDGKSNAIRIDTSKSYEQEEAVDIISDHTCIKLDRIPVEWIEKARANLHIVYGHTSHGSQITDGLLGLSGFKGSHYIYNKDLSTGSLDFRDAPFGYMDLGQPDNKTWAEETTEYLRNNQEINVVMWSWCGQLSWANQNDVDNYLTLMQKLEAQFTDVVFVYMTGHLDGTGEIGTLARNNQQIRDFCMSNNKVLYDFADIESYNPDGLYFGDKYANDACDYDSNGDKVADKNWATEWQNSHIKGVEWYACSSAHSQPVNANMKAYATWWLMARLAGWDGKSSNDY